MLCLCVSLIQAGNAVLTQLDRLRRYPNVLVLCTSNLTEMIDSAFVDRVDIKQFVGPPNVEARYEILRSQIEAMLRSVGIAAASMLLNDCGVALPLLSYQRLRGMAASEAAVQSLRNESPQGAATLLVCQQMEQIAQQCEVSIHRIQTSALSRRIPVAQQAPLMRGSFDSSLLFVCRVAVGGRSTAASCAAALLQRLPTGQSRSRYANLALAFPHAAAHRHSEGASRSGPTADVQRRRCQRLQYSRQRSQQRSFRHVWNCRHPHAVSSTSSDAARHFVDPCSSLLASPVPSHSKASCPRVRIRLPCCPPLSPSPPIVPASDCHCCL